MDKIVVFFVALWSAIKKFAEAPAIKPLVALFQSRRFVLLLIGFLVNFVLPTVPNLSPVWIQRLGDFAFIATGVLALGLTVQDVQEARSGLPTAKDDFIQQLIQQVANAVLSGLTAGQTAQSGESVHYPPAQTKFTESLSVDPVKPPIENAAA